jgi:hypothetical protein
MLKSIKQSKLIGQVTIKESLININDIQHIDNDSKVPIGIHKSNLPDAGHGLFAKKAIKAGSYICDYDGELIDGTIYPPSFNKIDTGFWSQIDQKAVIGNRTFSYGPYINDPLNNIQINCKIRYNRARKVFEVIALDSKISAGSELYTSYGPAFWATRISSMPQLKNKILQRHPELSLEIVQEGESQVNAKAFAQENAKAFAQQSDAKAFVQNKSKLRYDLLSDKKKKKMINRLMKKFKNNMYLVKRQLSCQEGDSSEKRITDLKDNLIIIKSKGKRIKLESKTNLNSKLSIQETIKKIKKTKTKKGRKFDNPSLKEAMSRSDWPEWEKAILEEYKQMVDDGVYEFTKGNLPRGSNLLGSMMILQLKRKPDGSIDKYKARLVALGNQQKKESYTDVSSGTARSSTVKLLMSLQAKLGSMSMVLDVKGAYLKSKIKEDKNEQLYLRLPDGSIVKLKRYLYGLKQAGLMWQENITQCLLNNQYNQSEEDPLTFSKWIGKRYIVMCIHVDDFFAIGSDKEILNDLYETLKLKYGEVSIKNGDLLGYLGMEIKTNSNGSITISQPGYVKKMINEFLPEGRLSKTPISLNESVKSGDDIKINKTDYLKAVGSINYLAQFTRPDLLYARSRVAQECGNPTGKSKRMVNKIFSYISNTMEYGITFSPGDIQLYCHVDASYNYYNDARGHMGYSFSLGKNDASFYAKSQKIKLVCLSSTEAEYVALCEATRDAVWLERLLSNIGFSNNKPVIMFEDNKSTIHMVHGRSNHKSNKHINPKFHYVKQQIKQGKIVVKYMQTNLMIADLLTKPLGGIQFTKLTKFILNQN